MKARFLHVADCHLGYRQYNRIERYDDFAHAFIHIMQIAVDEAVDFVVLAGDLFHKRAIDALTLNQAMVGLEKLQNAGIPCLAVEGNHELRHYDDHIGWMEFLAARHLLILLDAQFVEGEPQLQPYRNRRGAYIDVLPGLRVFGLGYRGAGTARAIAGYAAALDRLERDGVEYTLFVAHTGIEGVLPGQAGGLSHRQLTGLKPHVDYLALGHIHKPFTFDDWIYNPGSPETCSMTEAAWPERGYYLVEVDTDRAGADSASAKATPKHRAALYANARRPFVRMAVKTDLHDTPDALYAHCQALFERKARDTAPPANAPAKPPVVELQLTGVLSFDRTALDIHHLETLLQEAFDPLHVQVRNLARTADLAIDQDGSISRTELERQVLTELLEREPAFRTQSASWTELALSLKNLALSGSSTESILQELSEHVASLDDAPAEFGAANSRTPALGDAVRGDPENGSSQNVSSDDKGDAEPDDSGNQVVDNPVETSAGDE